MVNALDEAQAMRLDTVQVFTKNQQQWKAKPLDPGVVAAWHARVDELGWRGRVVSHASYLINLASPDDALWEKSITLMRDEIERCQALGIPFLVHHPGSSTTSDADTGLSRIAAGYGRLFKETAGSTVASCLENTVGGGSTLGRTWEELADLRGRIVAATGEPDRVGFCIDTCHAHAAGYDLSTRSGAEAVLNELHARCGLANVRVLHLNDSKAALGSRRDLHAHIGEGTIGRPPGPRRALRDTGFAAFVNRPEFAAVPKILETPKGTDEQGRPFDTINLRRLRGLLAASDASEASEQDLAGPGSTGEGASGGKGESGGEEQTLKQGGSRRRPRRPTSRP